MTLNKLYPEVLNKVVGLAIRTHEIHGILTIGRSRGGKSTCSYSSGFAISGYHIRKQGRDDLKPSVVTANRIDFFRMEPGSKEKPTIADEILLNKMSSENLKALGIPSEEDALLWARWGGTQFHPNQSRQVNINPYNKRLRKKFGIPAPVAGRDFVSRVCQSDCSQLAEGLIR